MAHYGDSSLECAPAYYMYGAALLCKAQEDATPLGGPAAPRAGAAGAAAGAPAPAGASAAAAAAAAEEEVDGSDEEGEEGEEQDMSDLQLAYENLDTARLVYSAAVAAGEGGHEEALAQVHLKLGQVLLEEEQWEAGLTEFDAAHLLFNRLIPPPHRRIAGLLYEASVALEALQRPAEALARMREAIRSARARADELRMGDAAAGAQEAAELARTLEELGGRAEELEESCQEQARMKDALRRAMLAGAGGAGPSAGGFDAPRLAGAAPTSLGVVGCGVTRVTPAPAGAGGAGGAGAAAAPRRIAPAPMAAAAAPAAAAAAKRPLDAPGPQAAGKQAKPAEEKPAEEGCKQQ